MNRVRDSVAFDLGCGAGPVAIVKYPITQGKCSSCGCYHSFRPEEIHPTRKATWRLMRYVSLLARYVPFAAMPPMLVEVPAATAYRYDRDVLEADLPPPDFDNIRALLVDEKAVHKGHGCVTSVLNADTGELLHLHEGKKKASLEVFFEKLNDEQKASVEAVCIDRNGAYRAVIKEQLPDAAVVYDRFHLIQNINKAIDEVRREAYREADAEGKNVIKGQRFNLYRNPENLSDTGEVALSYLLDINKKLNIAYVLKDQFRLVWTYSKASTARSAESSTNPAESRGIRSLDYLFLKLRQETALHF